ncbi:hypothetical protein B0H16DRAFT_1579858, partial [Mycena metata]
VLNAAAIGEFLARHNITISSKEISVASGVIRALQLSCTPPVAERLICHFRAFDSYWHRDLLSLGRMVHRSRNIRELTLAFADDLPVFRAHNTSWVLDSQRELLSAAYSVFSAMARKVDGPVIVLDPISPGLISGFLVCRAKDIAEWRLDLSQYNRAVVPKHLAARLLRPFRGSSGIPAQTNAQRCLLTEMHTVNISLQTDEPEVGSYTMLIFNMPFVTQLTLTPQLNALLGHLTLPALQTLSLNTPGIDAAVVPGIAHPTLTKIDVFGVQNICFTIKCLHLSPLLATFRFSVMDFDLTGLNPAFSLIAQHALDVHLQLTVHDNSLEAPGVLAEETASIAQNLRCLRSVVIICYSTHIALRILPWLALFPTLLKVRFALLIRGRGSQRKETLQLQGELQKFMTEAKNVLAHVPYIRGLTN